MKRDGGNAADTNAIKYLSEWNEGFANELAKWPRKRKLFTQVVWVENQQDAQISYCEIQYEAVAYNLQTSFPRCDDANEGVSDAANENDENLQWKNNSFHGTKAIYWQSWISRRIGEVLEKKRPRGICFYNRSVHDLAVFDMRYIYRILIFGHSSIAGFFLPPTTFIKYQAQPNGE